MIESIERRKYRDQEGIFNSANSASVQKAICRSLPDWDNFLVELVEFCNSTNTKHKCEHNIGRFLLKYFYKCPSVNRATMEEIHPYIKPPWWSLTNTTTHIANTRRKKNTKTSSKTTKP